MIWNISKDYWNRFTELGERSFLRKGFFSWKKSDKRSIWYKSFKDPKSRFYVVSHSGPKFEFFKSHVGFHWGPKISENHAKFPIFFAPRFARHALKYHIPPLRNSFLSLNILKIFAALRAVSSKICRFPFGPKFPNLKIRWGFPFGPKFPDFIHGGFH